MDSIRKPRLTEVTALKALLDGAAAEGRILSRDFPELYENVRDFYVYSDARGLGGSVAMHIDMSDLAEVRSLVVREDLRGRGIGRKLLAAVINEAETLDIARLYALTREPVFFERNGFRQLSRDALPYKVFKDCQRCPSFDHCDEVAVALDLRPVDASSGTEFINWYLGDKKMTILQGTIGFLGFGNMGAAIAQGLIATGAAKAEQLLTFDPVEDRQTAAKAAGLQVMATPVELAAASDTLLLAVKPQQMDAALTEIAAAIKPDALIVSIAAGISVAYIQQRLGADRRVVRTMPNTPALVQTGAAGFALSPQCTPTDAATAKGIFGAVGIAEQVAENDIDAVTALSGSGPAYFFYLVECLINAGVAEGLDEATATKLAAQTLLGAGKLLAESGETAATLRQRVTSKGGTTEAALKQFAADGFETIVAAAVHAAAARSRELGG